ncbi:hypothetical protein [Nocardioides sp. SYSU DS0663]|uniref:hypothetical protein n=1 Tax=Nocardioides sp. SYSU DS0663 TaxID=3416445 RepID=UPI003F4C80FF
MDVRRLLLLLMLLPLVIAGPPAAAAGGEEPVALDLVLSSVRAGQEATATLTATRGSAGVEGLAVAFEHTGPAPDESGSGSATTDADGRASYVVAIPEDASGELTVRAVVTDGEGRVVGEAGPVSGWPSTIVCRCGPGLKARNVNGGTDWVKVGRAEPGTKVKLFRVHDNGRRTLVRRGTMGDLGQKIFLLPDRARRHERTFQAVLRLPDGMRGVTARVSIR